MTSAKTRNKCFCMYARDTTASKNVYQLRQEFAVSNDCPIIEASTADPAGRCVTRFPYILCYDVPPVEWMGLFVMLREWVRARERDRERELLRICANSAELTMNERKQNCVRWQYYVLHSHMYTAYAWREKMVRCNEAICYKRLRNYSSYYGRVMTNKANLWLTIC